MILSGMLSRLFLVICAFMLIGTCQRVLNLHCENAIDIVVTFGKPFQITLQPGEMIMSDLPHWIIKETTSNNRVHLHGLLLEDDLRKQAIGLPSTQENQPTETTIFSNFKLHSLVILTKRCNVSNLCKFGNCLQLSMQYPWPLLKPTPDNSSDFSTSGWDTQNICFPKHPVVAIVKLAIQRSFLLPVRRILLWNILYRHFASLHDQEIMKLTEDIWLPDTESNFCLSDTHLITDNSLYILARANGSKWTSKMTSKGFGVIHAVWKIGCGFLDEKAIHVLSRLENRFLLSPVINDWLADTPTQFVQGAILDWIVGDYTKERSRRTPRTVNPSHQAAGFQEYSPIFPSRIAGAVSEASGMMPTDTRGFEGDNIDALGKVNSELLTNKKVRVSQPFAPLEITVYQIFNARIPPNTFSAHPAGGKLRLRLFEHIYPMQFGLDFKDVAATVGKEIQHDTSNWIAFDSVHENLRLRPYPEHVGRHNFVLCAYDTMENKACSPVSITVRLPAPIKKSFINQVSPGILWCCPIPLYWFEELKIDSLEEADISLSGDSPFAWNQKSGQLCVITKLRMEQIMAFFFRANSRALAQTVEVEFRLSVKVPPTEKLVVSPRIKLKLRWMARNSSYEMREINRLNISFGQALRIRVNPNINPQHIFVYDILQIRNFQERHPTATSQRFELELVYLPLGLPDASSSETWSLLDELSTRADTQTGLVFTHNGEMRRFNRVLSLCENARLEGGVDALRAAADSFRPFTLESATELPINGSACERAFALSKHTRGLSSDTLAPAPPQPSSALHQVPSQGVGAALPITATGIGSGDRNFVGLLPLPSIPFSEQVIENFTVEAGLAFKKLINPIKVVPIGRIRAIEIVNEENVRINDSAWLKVSNDYTHIYGLPLKRHIKDSAHRFWLNILSIDQRSPISIHFTVDVVKWPAKISSFSRRPSWSYSPNYAAIARPMHNHQVRIRLRTATASSSQYYREPSTLAYRLQPSQIPLTFYHTSLLYRWNLVTSLDKYLRPGCEANCGGDLMLMDINDQGPGVIEATVAQLSLLREGARMWSMGFRDSLAENTTTACPRKQIDAFQRKLLKVPLNYRYNDVVATAQPLLQQDFQAGELRHAPWAHPAASLRKHLEAAGLGTVEVLALDLIGHCFSSRWSGTDHDAMEQVTFHSVLNFTTYIAAIEVNDTSWISLENGKCAIYGIVLKTDVFAGFHEFRLMGSSPVTTLSRIFVEVVEKNPRLPEVPNHRVLLRFEPGYAVRSDTRTHMLQTLSRKWLFLVTLDEYLRPECKGQKTCSSDFDILLINIASNGDALNVIWAKKSLVYVSENHKTASAWTLNSPLETFYRAKRSKTWSYSPPDSFQASTMWQQHDVGSDVADARMAEPLEHNEHTCPWQELVKLTQRLLGDSGHEFQMLPELVNRFATVGFGKLIEVKVEKLGPCAQTKTKGEPKEEAAPSVFPFANKKPFLETPGYDANSIQNLIPKSGHNLPSPLPLDASAKEPDDDTATSAAKYQQQRAFLLTTLLPICACIILILIIALVVIWFLKFRGGDLRESGKTRSTVGCDKNQEPVPLISENFRNSSQNGKHLQPNNHAGIKDNGIQTKVDKSFDRLVTKMDDIEETASPPSKPLILPNEKPPLPPPEMLSPMGKGMVNTINPNYNPRSATPTNYQVNMRPYYAMGPRPDPYRNLPPPIDSRFGLPRQLAPQYGPFRRDPVI